ncbi:MAG: hypothetical protein QW478_07545, partial [Candidatus Micrarchaeaceae archaeon]
MDEGVGIGRETGDESEEGWGRTSRRDLELEGLTTHPGHEEPGFASCLSLEAVGPALLAGLEESERHTLACRAGVETGDQDLLPRGEVAGETRGRGPHGGDPGGVHDHPVAHELVAGV